MRHNINLRKEIDWIFTLKVLCLKVRREAYISFRPRKVIKILASRPPFVCSGCSHYCCSEIFKKTPFNCEHLKEDGSCVAYPDNLSASCIVYPLDLKDSEYEFCPLRKGLFKEAKKNE